MDGFLVPDASAAETTPAPDAAEVIGFASFGPERGEDDRLGQPLSGPPDQDRAELYAIYVLPRYWSSGAGRALLDRALALAAEAGYADISLWVLEGNERGRRFCEQAGVRPLIDRVMPLSQARDGFAAMIDGTQHGKIIFIP